MVEYTGYTGLLAIFKDNKYICDYPNDPDTDKIITAHDMHELYIFRKENDCIFYKIPRYEDIVDRISIDVNSSCDIYIKIGPDYVYKDHIHSGTNIIRPFKFGIPIIKLPFQEICVVIHNTTMFFDCKVSINTILLDSPDRQFLAKNPLIFNNIKITDGKWHQEKYIEGPAPSTGYCVIQ